MVLIELRKMYPGILTMQEQEKEVRAFSSMKNAVRWLKKNNFSYGRRPFFVYQGNSREWIHKNDVLWHFIQVTIYEYKSLFSIPNGESRILRTNATIDKV